MQKQPHGVGDREEGGRKEEREKQETQSQKETKMKHADKQNRPLPASRSIAYS